ncbi:unnamed protein product, partial [Mesorhabditis spiculigera]
MQKLTLVLLFVVAFQLASSLPKRERRLVLSPGKVIMIEPGEGSGAVEGSGIEGSGAVEGSGVEGSGVEGSGAVEGSGDHHVEGSGQIEGSGVEEPLTAPEKEKKLSEDKLLPADFAKRDAN